MKFKGFRGRVLVLFESQIVVLGPTQAIFQYAQPLGFSSRVNFEIIQKPSKGYWWTPMTKMLI